MRVIVRNGTNAGVKPPMKDRPTAKWRCRCSDEFGESLSKLNPPYLVRCPGCGMSRP